MTVEPQNPNSRTILAGGDAQCAQPAFISVKEAAQRLGVSRSTVYRINRDRGPFSFTVDGRKIYIDYPSFELHLARKRGIGGEPEMGPDEQSHLCPDDRNPKQTDPQPLALQINAGNAAVQNGHPTSITSGGQRDLVLTKQFRPALVCYQSFLA